jgi:hypothetical protein
LLIIFTLLAAPLLGFATCPARREKRFALGLCSSLPTRPFSFLHGTGMLFGLQCRRTFRGGFHLGSGALGRLTLFARLFLSFPRGDPDLASRDDRLPRLPSLGRFRAVRGGFGALQSHLLRFLRGAKPVG